MSRRLWPEPVRRARVVRRLLRALWAGQVPRAVRVLATHRRWATDPQAVDEFGTYLQDRAAWIPEYRVRRRERRYIGSGLAEQANDRIVARRQKRRGMHWGRQSSDGLAALRTLRLNRDWDRYWHGRFVPLVA